MSGIVVIFLFVAVAASVLFHVMSKRGGSSIQPQNPDHFDLLDDNGDPIKEPKVKKVIEGGNSDAPVQELQYFCIKDKGYNVSVWPKYNGYPNLDYIEFKIAGITHGEHVSEHLGEFVATLEPEPTNPYDQNAIKIVTSEGHRISTSPKTKRSTFVTSPLSPVAVTATSAPTTASISPIVTSPKMTNERKCFTFTKN